MCFLYRWLVEWIRGKLDYRPTFFIHTLYWLGFTRIITLSRLTHSMLVSQCTMWCLSLSDVTRGTSDSKVYLFRGAFSAGLQRLWYCATWCHTPRVCGCDVSAVTLKIKALTFTSLFLTFLSRFDRKRFANALLAGAPFRDFCLRTTPEAVVYDIAWHLLMLGYYVSFRYCDATEALQAATEQCSDVENLLLKWRHWDKHPWVG